MYAVESPLRLRWKRVRHNETDEEKEKEREQRRLSCDPAVQSVASATPSEDTDETDEEKATHSSLLSSYRMYLRVSAPVVEGGEHVLHMLNDHPRVTPIEQYRAHDY